MQGKVSLSVRVVHHDGFFSSQSMNVAVVTLSKGLGLGPVGASIVALTSAITNAYTDHLSVP